MEQTICYVKTTSIQPFENPIRKSNSSNGLLSIKRLNKYKFNSMLLKRKVFLTAMKGSDSNKINFV